MTDELNKFEGEKSEDNRSFKTKTIKGHII